MRISPATIAGLMALAIPGIYLAHPRDADGPERRAVAFLEREVPRWSKQNRCFSCHNNGDAARALLASIGTPFAAKPEALADTIDFLGRPDRWDKNGADAPFSDKTLARVQFASAMDASIVAGRIADRSSLAKAAEIVAKDQAEDGSWPIDDAAPIGSPTTYGPSLATAVARTTLHHANSVRFEASIKKADRWMRNHPILNTLDASSALIAIPDDPALRVEAIALLRLGQNDDGGWGPFARSASEPFDTAMALLSLSRLRKQDGVDAMIRRGRSWLIASQKPDGSWPETTRPAGGESYAQRLSTTGWATSALLATRDR